MKLYVVTEPPEIRGIYATWAECKAAVSGVRGARYQAVSSRPQAEALLRGEPIVLPPALWAFVDGNHLGGVGLVLVEQGEAGPRRVEEVGTTVYEVYRDAGISGLGSRSAVTAAANRLRNILAELGAFYLALGRVPRGSALTVVHDYEGVAAWFEGRWQARDPLVARIVAACRARAAARGLTVAFRRQRGHESTVAGRNDFAAYHARADRLATEAALRG